MAASSPGLAGRSIAGGRDQVASAVVVGVVDAAAGEHPHPTERQPGVLAQHQRLQAAGSVAQHDHGGRRYGLRLPVSLQLLVPLLE